MLLIWIFEYIGTVAFSISGALLGMKKQLDLFGVVFLSIITAVGGGILRDIIIGNTPPMAFRYPVYCLISLVSALITCFFYKRIIKLESMILIFYAAGLGVFTAVGANTALLQNMGQPFIVVAMGLITGVGGGIMRDVFVRDIPLVFRKDIYAVASIIGALCMFYTRGFVPSGVSLYICFAAVFVLRVVSIRRKLNLPVFKIDQETEA